MIPVILTKPDSLPTLPAPNEQGEVPVRFNLGGPSSQEDGMAFVMQFGYRNSPNYQVQVKCLLPWDTTYHHGGILLTHAFYRAKKAMSARIDHDRAVGERLQGLGEMSIDEAITHLKETFGCHETKTKNSDSTQS